MNHRATRHIVAVGRTGSSHRSRELVQSDQTFRMPALHLADAKAIGGGRVHMYELTWDSPNNGGALGACHGFEAPQLFGTYDRHLGPLLLGPEPPAEARERSQRRCARPGELSRRPEIRAGPHTIRTDGSSACSMCTRKPPPIPRRRLAASGSTTPSVRCRC